MLRVQKQKCDQCLFSKNKVVSNARKNDILRQCIENQNYFNCHKNQTIENEDKELVCRGYYDELGHYSQMIRICERINAIEFVQIGNILKEDNNESRNTEP